MPFKDDEARRAYHKAYNSRPEVAGARYARNREKGYKAAPKKREKRERRELPLAPFVAIDSEGFTFGDPIREDDAVYNRHKTFLWGAGDIGGETDFLVSEKPLGTVEICEWLLRLPNKFGRAIYVSFAFGYDAAQIVADLPYEKAWELQKGKSFKNPEKDKNPNRIVFWKNYGFQFLKAKKFCVYKFPREGAYKDRKSGRVLNPIAKILIYDVFGFFQSSFVKAAKSMPGAATKEEMELIESGKKDRAIFQPDQIEFIRRYTTAELVVLSRMMTLLRESMLGANIKLRNWFGAGSIAQALLKREGVKEHYSEIVVRDMQAPQEAALRAFFGGRIELIKQGSTKNVLHQYDVASAYPAIISVLPSMREGTWITHAENVRGRIASANILSLVRVRTRFELGKPFYPLPYRIPNGSILFPARTDGYYCIDEVRAAIKWAEHYDCVDKMEFVDMLEFIPGNDEKPFAFVPKLFEYRKSLKKTDITQIVIKLGLNSLYGKTAQGVGGTANHPPTYANPFYAAAITAGTRARLLEAAILDPKVIVMLATDGIVSTRALPLDCPREKTLGAWEYGKSSDGGVFVQSGVYFIGDDAGNITVKSRGFRPANVTNPLSEILRCEIPDYWRAGRSEYSAGYSAYMTIGAAVTTRDAWQHVGRWREGVRVMNLESLGKKRMRLASRHRERADRLISSEASNVNALLTDENGLMPMSAPHVPEWLDLETELERALADDAEMIEARFER